MKKFIAFLFHKTMVQPILWYWQGYRYGLSYRPIQITDTDKHFPYRQNRYIGRYRYYRPIPIPIMISVAPWNIDTLTQTRKRNTNTNFLFSFELNFQSLNWGLPLRKCSIKENEKPHLFMPLRRNMSTTKWMIGP